MIKALLLSSITAISLMASNINYVEMKPLSTIIKVIPSSVKDDTTMPIITWGADTATIAANGYSNTTVPNSEFGFSGIKLKLEKNDDFISQAKKYLSGETPYLRGTVSMINMVADMVKDDNLKPVIITQLSWSNGGDALVVKDNIKTLSDLKGKTIAIQAYGPHLDLLVATLKTANLSINDINIKYVKELTDTQNSDPATALREDSQIDAAFVITPDALTLTSNGNIGNGAEGSVKGAKILFTTKSANKVIADVIAVRNDYYKTNKTEIEGMVNKIFKGQELVMSNLKDKKTISKYASIILNSPDSIEDMEGLISDMRFTNVDENQTFLTDINNSRSLANVSNQSAQALYDLKILSTNKSSILAANHNWNNIKNGVKQVVKTKEFDSNKVSEAVSNKQKTGTLDEDTIINFEIYFQPNQKDFSASLYKKEFDRVVEIANTFGGAVITIEGHSDNLNYLKKEKEGASVQELKQLRQAAKNLSLARANSVKESLLEYAKSNNVTMDPNQFALIGWGIEKPSFNPPKNKQEWYQNMKVTFKIIKVEAEATSFEAL